MSQTPMAAPHLAGSQVQGPLPAGMLRIQQGNQERYIWPVHLPGWLALGWRVAGPSTTATEPLPQAVMAPAVAPEPNPELTAIQKGPEPATGRGKRGRGRKEEPQQPPVAIDATPTETGTTAEEDHADFEPPAASASTDDQSSAEREATPVAEPAIEAQVPLSALPDDLFDDPLI